MDGTGTEEPRRLADFLRDHRDEILAAWEKSVRTLGAARNLSHPVLLNHMSEFMDDLAAYVDHLRAGVETEPPRENPRIHALERLQVGYDLSEVVEEYAILRRCIAGMAVRAGAPAVRSVELPLLHQAIDQAISTSVVRYSEARERTLRALDRISSTALLEHDVESLLPKLLDAFLETTASVDSVALSLREDGSLRVRAAVGFPPPGPVGQVVLPGSFSARVEKQGSLFLRDASADPAIARSPSCAPGTRAMYGNKLSVGGGILGVVVMGSRSSSEFSQEDQLLFRTMVNRAGEIIAHARLQAVAERRAAELEAVIESIPEAVFVGDEKGIRHANTAALQLIGARTPAEIEGLANPAHGARWIDGRPVSLEEHVFIKALRGERGTMLIRRHHAEKDEDVVVQVSAAPVQLDGRTVGAVAVDTDVTERIGAEEELRAALDFRDRMLGVLSHDLRNPLGVILASMHVLERAALDEGQRRSLARVSGAARRIERMIRDLLDYTRTRQGRGLPLSRREVDLADLCKQAIDDQHVLHPQRSVRFDAQGDTRGSFDPDRAGQVVANLISNALHYSPPGTPVDVSLRESDGSILLEVRNLGPPIAEDLLPRIFEAFQRGPQGSGEGLGLGLYIVKHLVEAHDGTIEVRSTPADGTSFIVRWPKSGLAQ